MQSGARTVGGGTSNKNLSVIEMQHFLALAQCWNSVIGQFTLIVVFVKFAFIPIMPFSKQMENSTPSEFLLLTVASVLGKDVKAMCSPRYFSRSFCPCSQTLTRRVSTLQLNVVTHWVTECWEEKHLRLFCHILSYNLCFSSNISFWGLLFSYSGDYQVFVVQHCVFWGQTVTYVL